MIQPDNTNLQIYTESYVSGSHDSKFLQSCRGDASLLIASVVLGVKKVEQHAIFLAIAYLIANLILLKIMGAI